MNTILGLKEKEVSIWTGRFPMPRALGASWRAFPMHIQSLLECLGWGSKEGGDGGQSVRAHYACTGDNWPTRPRCAPHAPSKLNLMDPTWWCILLCACTLLSWSACAWENHCESGFFDLGTRLGLMFYWYTFVL